MRHRQHHRRQRLTRSIKRTRCTAIATHTLRDTATGQSLTGVTYPGGVTRQYHYGEPGLVPPGRAGYLTGISDETQTRHATFSYDDKGRVTSSRLHADAPDTTTLAYLSNGDVEVETSGRGRRIFEIGTGTYRRIGGVADSRGRTTTTRDAMDRLQSITDACGTSRSYTYPTDDQVVERVTSGGVALKSNS